MVSPVIVSASAVEAAWAQTYRSEKSESPLPFAVTQKCVPEGSGVGVHASRAKLPVMPGLTLHSCVPWVAMLEVVGAVAA